MIWRTIGILAFGTLAWAQTGWQTSGNNVYLNGGNVGIGTSSPTTSLDVNGVISVGGQPALYNQGSGVTTLAKGPNARFDLTGAGGLTSVNPWWRGYMFATADQITRAGVYQYPRTSFYHSYSQTTDPVDMYFNISTGNTELPFGLNLQTANGGRILLQGGNVGIGITNPQKTLHVNGDIAQGSSTVYSTLHTDTTSGNLSLSVSGTSNAINVLNSGYVGIGTTNPQQKLSVNGTIGTREVVVTNSGWSDYVFQPDYRLPPLKDVAAYIRENHHLPDIPTEAEVRGNGVGLGEMQTKLLAKIEELTLHMIRADERNARLEKENRDLQERMARLETARRE